MNYWTEQHYRDDRGAVVIKRTSFATDSDHTTEVFLGTGTIMLNTPMGEMPHEFEVPLDVDNIGEAFEKFAEEMEAKAPEVAEAEAKKVMDEIKSRMQEQQSSIITPDQMKGFNPNVRG